MLYDAVINSLINHTVNEALSRWVTNNAFCEHNFQRINNESQ